MNIVLVTNTFTSHVGGVARSVEAFSEEYRRLGHRVLVIAPEFPDIPEDEVDVIRVPAIQKFNASDFSVALPIPSGLIEALQDFRPDVIHSQHPFLLGMTAVRLARYFELPLVFTHHTLYEQYTHYVPGNSTILQNFIIELGTSYANLSDQVFAPSDSIRDLLLKRGVTTPIAVVPTGVRIERFARGQGELCRSRLQIPASAFVAGHMGRLAPEKNLRFLAQAVIRFLQNREDAVFLLVGSGSLQQELTQDFADAGLQERVFMAGVLEGQALADALAAMDVFVFASQSETQGMVLTEAMAAGTPVVAVDASGAREVVRDGVSGRLLPKEDLASFVEALNWVHDLSAGERDQLVAGARAVAEEYSLANTAQKALSCYQALCPQEPHQWEGDEQRWKQIMRFIGAEWEVLKSISSAGDDAINAYLLESDKGE